MTRRKHEYTVTMTVVADTLLDQKVKREIKLLIDRGIAEQMADYIIQTKFVKVKRK